MNYLKPGSDYKLFKKIYTYNYTNMVPEKFDNIFIEFIDKTGRNLAREDLQRIERQSVEEISACPSDGPNDKCKAREYTHHLPDIYDDDKIQIDVTSSALGLE
jgi:hypothetical protein